MNRSPLFENGFDLSNFGVEELISLWRRHLPEKVLDHLPRSLMARLLAYRLQVERQGGLSKKTTAYLKAIECDLREGRKPQTPYLETQQLKPGCQLVREYDGLHHHIKVLEQGFEWNQKTFTSLSAVAKAITGTNWNGHRFFGLKEKGESAVEASQ